LEAFEKKAQNNNLRRKVNVREVVLIEPEVSMIQEVDFLLISGGVFAA
jgi:hypothetical protein